MPASKKPSAKTASQTKTTAKEKAEKPEQFEEQRSTALRMQPQPLGKSATAKNKK